MTNGIRGVTPSTGAGTAASFTVVVPCLASFVGVAVDDVYPLRIGECVPPSLCARLGRQTENRSTKRENCLLVSADRPVPHVAEASTWRTGDRFVVFTDHPHGIASQSIVSHHSSTSSPPHRCRSTASGHDSTCLGDGVKSVVHCLRLGGPDVNGFVAVSSLVGSPSWALSVTVKCIDPFSWRLSMFHHALARALSALLGEPEAEDLLTDFIRCCINIAVCFDAGRFHGVTSGVQGYVTDALASVWSIRRLSLGHPFKSVVVFTD